MIITLRILGALLLAPVVLLVVVLAAPFILGVGAIASLVALMGFIITGEWDWPL
jgi:hypothetical protein